MIVLRALAPAKINLGLFLGPRRARDGRHELVSVMQSISLADELTLTPAPEAASDEVICPGVAGPASANLAAAALRAFRSRTGWEGPAQRLEIVKRIPVAAGLGGGSADAAAALRLARAASGLGDEQLLLELGATLGADVPAQISPGRWLAGGAGEELSPLPAPRSALGVLVLPLAAELSTRAVYEEADRLGLARSGRELQQRRAEIVIALEDGAPLPASSALLENDLQRAATSLCPQIADGLLQVRAAGAEIGMLSGSGPTVLGLFQGSRDPLRGGLALAEDGARALGSLVPAPFAALPVDASFGSVSELSPG